MEGVKKSSVMKSGRAASDLPLFLVRASWCYMVSSAGPINPVDLICNVLRWSELPQSGLRKERFFKVASVERNFMKYSISSHGPRWRACLSVYGMEREAWVSVVHYL